MSAPASAPVSRVGWLRGLAKPLPIAVSALTLSALLLLGPARDTMNVGAACLTLLHIGLGLLLVPPVAFVLVRALKHARHSGSATGLATLALLSAVCALTGLFLFLRALFGGSAAHEVFVWWLHVFAGFVAVGGGVSYGRSRLKNHPVSLLSSPSAQPEESGAGTHLFAARVPRLEPRLLLLLLLFAAPGALWVTTDQIEYAADDYYRDLTATNTTQARNPHFPAGLRLAEEDAAPNESARRWNTQSADYCGRSGCHTEAYQEWLPSGHRFAGDDPFYLRVKAEFAARKGEEAARWCAGCHAPQTLIGAQEFKSSEPPKPAAPPEYRTSSGVDCLTCHAMTGTPTRSGNGHFTLALAQSYPFAARTAGWQRRLHEFLLRVRPAPHQRAFLKPELHGAAEMCAACHRQSFNVPQNHYQVVRGPDPYGEWLSGPFSGRMARASGLAARPIQTCQDCHFPSTASGYTSHAALGANTVLPALYGDSARLAQTETFLRANRLSLDIFALRRIGGAAWRQEPWIAPLDAPQESQDLPRPGETWLLDIVVRNRNVGHSFPNGYEDIKDSWLEVTLEDGAKRRLAVNGALDREAGPLPPDTHAYRLVGLDRDGNALTRHNLTEQVTTVYRRAIPPGASDIARYRLVIPKQGPDGKPLLGPLRLRARLRYRHLRPDFALWALEGKPLLLPITTLAEATVTLPVMDRRGEEGNGNKEARKPGNGDTEKGKDSPSSPLSLAERFENYGLGLLAPAEGADVAGALRAFRKARQLAPRRPEPLLGLGRAYLTEPALLAARTQFEEALRLSPDLPAARAGLGVVYSRQGEYDRALSLLKPLAAQFPQDSALLSDLGVAYFRRGMYEEAAAAFERALAADPDDAATHNQLKLCYQRLQRVPEARREEAIGRYLAQENGLTTLLVPAYLQNPAHADDRRAARPFPEHLLRSPSNR